MRSIVIGAAIAGLIVGCAGSRSSIICQDLAPDPAVQGDVATLNSEGDEAWKGRLEEAQLAKAIDAWEKSLKIDPKQYQLRVKLARAHYLMADGHVRFDEEREEQMLAHFESGVKHAEVALGQQFPEFRNRFCSRRPLKAQIAALDKGAVPAAYWYATNLGKYGLAKSIIVVLNQKDRIKALMDMVKKLDDTYFYSAADRYFGAYYTKIPYPNGDLPKSKSHFEATIAAQPNYLGSKVLMADLWAIKAGDRETFKRLLDEVVAADPKVIPEVEPENTIEQRKAKMLLEEIDLYFPLD